MTTLKPSAALAPALIAVLALAVSLICCSSSDPASRGAAKAGAGSEALGDAGSAGQNEGHAGAATIGDPSRY